MKKKITESSPNNSSITKTSSKRQMPVKNDVTDTVKNTASHENGLNQSKTTRDDLLPSDGDNPTT